MWVTSRVRSIHPPIDPQRRGGGVGGLAQGIDTRNHEHTFGEGAPQLQWIEKSTAAIVARVIATAHVPALICIGVIGGARPIRPRSLLRFSGPRGCHISRETRNAAAPTPARPHKVQPAPGEGEGEGGGADCAEHWRLGLTTHLLGMGRLTLHCAACERVCTSGSGSQDSCVNRGWVGGGGSAGPTEAGRSTRLAWWSRSVLGRPCVFRGGCGGLVGDEGGSGMAVPLLTTAAFCPRGVPSPAPVISQAVNSGGRSPPHLTSALYH